jgi:hypothetical protein
VAAAEGVGVRNVKVAPAGISSKAYVNVSIQNWHTSEVVIGPVTGMPAVTVIVGLAVTVMVAVLVALIVVVEVTCVAAVAVDEPC